MLYETPGQTLAADSTRGRSSPSAGLDPLTPTIFHTAWWLEAASGGTCEEVVVRSGGHTIGRLPFMVTSHSFGLRLCSEPELCHALGPAVDVGPGSVSKRNSRHFEITQALIEQLPNCSAYGMPLHAGTVDTFAFSEANWRTRVQFTFVMHPKGEAALWRGLRDKTRNVIRRAEERWEVTAITDPAEFSRIYQANLATRRVLNHYRRIEPVCAAAMQRGRGQVLAVRDNQGEVLAAIFIAWDQQVMYYLLTTRSPAADNGVVSLLLWHSIKMANSRSLMFDFDSVGAPGSRPFFAGFGGQVEPRYIVGRSSALYSSGRWARQAARTAYRRLPL